MKIDATDWFAPWFSLNKVLAITTSLKRFSGSEVGKLSARKSKIGLAVNDLSFSKMQSDIKSVFISKAVV